MATTFDWSSLLGPDVTTSGQSGLLPNDQLSNQRVPSLVHSSASSPESTESSEPSPHANDIAVHPSQKRKSAGASALTASGAHKDAKAGKGTQHSHDTQDGLPTNKKSGPSKGTGQISEKRRDQNRAAQKAFRERKEKHLYDLESKIAELEGAARERDAQNDNLRDLVNQLRQENERLGASQNKFAQSAFTFEPLASTSALTTSPAASVSPAALTGPAPEAALRATATSMPPVATFPSVSIGGLGDQFLAELSGRPLRQTTPQSGSSFSSNDPPASASPLAADPSTSFDIFTPGGRHLNLGDDTTAFGGSSTAGSFDLPSSMTPFGLADLGDWREPITAPGELDDYFVGLTSPPPSGAAAASNMAKTSSNEGNVAAATSSACPLGDTELDNLCTDMMSKATCQEYARKALEDALKQDVATQSQLSSSSFR